MVQGGERGVIHLHREGSFYRAYEWSAYLSCRYLHEFKVNKRAFNGIEQPVAYIGFPETSLDKWMPEGAELKEIEEKHLTIRLPDLMLQNDPPDILDAAYLAWKDAILIKLIKERKPDGVMSLTWTLLNIFLTQLSCSILWKGVVEKVISVKGKVFPLIKAFSVVIPAVACQ